VLTEADRPSNNKLFPVILLFIFVTLTGCQQQPGGDTKQLTLAVNSGVEGDALKAAAKDYEAQTDVHINIAEFPYANLFEKELIDLNAHTAAYDLIMLDDPWFPRRQSESEGVLDETGVERRNDDAREFG
jgi:ABC-type glycerol-3-phosphate transport system substrate-binding protein